MALPLNRYRSFALNNLTTSAQDVYEAPVGYSAVVMMAQACNTSAALPQNITLSVQKLGQPEVFLTNNFQVYPNDSTTLLTGKLVLEPGDKVRCLSSTSEVNLVLSILETRI